MADAVARMQRIRGEEQQQPEADAPKAEKPAAGRKRKITVYWRESLLEEARSAVLALGSEGLEPSNLSQLFDGALERELERLRELYNDGRPFPPYRSRLPGGRPPKA
jgi:hypothetical protein